MVHAVAHVIHGLDSKGIAKFLHPVGASGYGAGFSNVVPIAVQHIILHIPQLEAYTVLERS